MRTPRLHPGADGQGEKRRHPDMIWGGPSICSGFRPVDAALPYSRSILSFFVPYTSSHLGLEFSLGLCIPPYSLGLCPPVFSAFYFRFVSSL